MNWYRRQLYQWEEMKDMGVKREKGWSVRHNIEDGILVIGVDATIITTEEYISRAGSGRGVMIWNGLTYVRRYI